MDITGNSNKYYKHIGSTHVTGDIWMGLPTLGILKPKICSGLIITPACDLANSKVETITYLPIIPLKSWFASRSYYYEVRSTLMTHLREKIPTIGEQLLKNKLPSLEAIDDLKSSIEKFEVSAKKDREHQQRCLIGVEILKSVVDCEIESCNLQSLKVFLGDKAYNTTLVKLIRNGLSNDIHFLPKDGDPSEWSSIPLHSIVLFRYPITVPIEIFDTADDYTCLNWSAAMDNIGKSYPIAEHFKANQPLKTITLKNDFLSDLLTRFVGLYVRIGSPDFSNDTIDEIINEIHEK